MQLGVKLHWLHLRDHCPSPLLHMATSMMLIMIPFVDVVIIFSGSMIGGETHWLDVSLGEEISHTFCITCSKGSMGDDMATIVKHLLIYEVVYGIDLIPYGDDFLFIIYGMVWASMIHNVGGKLFGDLVLFLPLEGNFIAAQDQQTLYTYHNWRGG